MNHQSDTYVCMTSLTTFCNSRLQFYLLGTLSEISTNLPTIDDSFFASLFWICQGLSGGGMQWQWWNFHQYADNVPTVYKLEATVKQSDRQIDWCTDWRGDARRDLTHDSRIEGRKIQLGKLSTNLKSSKSAVELQRCLSTA